MGYALSKTSGHSASSLEHSGDHHAQMIHNWRWRDFINIILGFWLIASPATLGYQSSALLWSDIVSGSIVIALACLSLNPRFDLARWGICLIGIWLLMAPLILWAPDAASYNNNTLIGPLLIALSVLIPMMPGRTHHQIMMLPGPEIPPGWSYNPSDWIQRGPIIAFAFIGFFLSRYLASYQLGHINYPWDPLFLDGTRKVLDSDVSKAWPVSDAGLGAVTYMLEALSGFMGGSTRWRTMPWMVAMFGVLVVPLGIVSIILVMLQPVAVGAWCTLCLVTAAAMLIMISPAIDEVVAMGQYLGYARRQGKPFWRTFWLGGTFERYKEQEQSSIPSEYLPLSLTRSIFAALDLNNIPWNVLLCAALGIWLLFSPTVLGLPDATAHSNYIGGALIITISVIAFSEIARPARLLNIPLALWIIAAPWVLAHAMAGLQWIDLIACLAILVLSFRRGRIEQHFGNWNRYLI